MLLLNCKCVSVSECICACLMFFLSYQKKGDVNVTHQTRDLHYEWTFGIFVVTHREPSGPSYVSARVHVMAFDLFWA